MKLTPRGLWWLKLALHCVCVAPIAYLMFLVITDNAGGDPVQYIIHYTGMGALNTLIATLMVSPLAKFAKQGLILRTRRLLGLYVFTYASLHIAAFISLDLLFAWGFLFEEIIKRPYILVGATAYILLLGLALTSLDTLKRKMGRNWQKLHNSVYVIALLVPIHFYWSVKSEIIEPSIYIGLCVLLLWLRRKQIMAWMGMK